MMMTIRTHLNVSELMYYREFDRVAKPAPRVFFINQYSVDEVVSWVSKNGIDEEHALLLAVCNGKALLTDGNHRIVAASILNIPTVPVDVVYYDTEEELRSVYYPHTIERFKEIV